jgi:2,4'-dihydroxyacetophenone dioxygenase
VNKPIDLPAAETAAAAAAGTDKVPYQKPQPWGMAPDMVVPDLLTDDQRLWAPVAPQIWSRPVHLNVTGGFYIHLLKVTRSGLLQRHRHSGQVHAYTIKGRWRYLEHDWVAEEGGYVFEPPGETHTLVVPEDCTEMITLFTVHGALMYVDPQGNSTGYDDVFTRIEKYRAHFENVGLGADHVKRFMR